MQGRGRGACNCKENAAGVSPCRHARRMPKQLRQGTYHEPPMCAQAVGPDKLAVYACAGDAADNGGRQTKDGGGGGGRGPAARASSVAPLSSSSPPPPPSLPPFCAHQSGPRWRCLRLSARTRARIAGLSSVLNRHARIPHIVLCCCLAAAGSRSKGKRAAARTGPYEAARGLALRKAGIRPLPMRVTGDDARKGQVRDKGQRELATACCKLLLAALAACCCTRQQTRETRSFNQSMYVAIDVADI